MDSLIIAAFIISILYLTISRNICSYNSNKDLQFRTDIAKYIYLNIVLLIPFLNREVNYVYGFVICFLFFTILSIIPLIININNRSQTNKIRLTKLLLDITLKSIGLSFSLFLIEKISAEYTLLLFAILYIIVDVYSKIKKNRKNELKKYNNIYPLPEPLKSQIENHLSPHMLMEGVISYYDNELINAHLLAGKNGKNNIIVTSKAINTLNTEEIIAIIGHEIGHEIGKHSMIYLIKMLSNLLLLLFMYLVVKFCILNSINLFLGFVFIVLSIDFLMLFFKFLYNTILRQQEYLADKYSSLTFSSTDLINALRKIELVNDPISQTKLGYYINSPHPFNKYRIKKIKSYHEFIQNN
ncbi:Zn-dependent protease with chaperone function [Dysgonomonas alginatilytica]|uniref:Zn-dependent protease with chaperone function n=1 Tax=Dysgonomonas alginatilytica TaxID=1605892 RepID=A0A2V3PJ09_9BACT|nr:M48 family metallopeptidase [Dysgonomonas alginatilytica]PXV60035.1 Zn-dependent protease with chaperone function [Dysgonomonas alginatilytica]